MQMFTGNLEKNGVQSFLPENGAQFSLPKKRTQSFLGMGLGRELEIFADVPCVAGARCGLCEGVDLKCKEVFVF